MRSLQTNYSSNLTTEMQFVDVEPDENVLSYKVDEGGSNFSIG